MNKYLFDTCTVSDVICKDAATLGRLKYISPSDVAISSVTLMEIEFGLLKNPDKARKIRNIIIDFIDSVSVIGFGDSEAIIAAKIRNVLRKTGRPIGNFDMLIAATAITSDMILVSSNMREFERVTGLRLENWRL